MQRKAAPLGVSSARDLLSLATTRAHALPDASSPGTAHGFIFLSVEDETGIANAIIQSELYERHPALVTYAGASLITGTVQNVDRVIHLRARNIEALNLTNAPVQSHNFY